MPSSDPYSRVDYRRFVAWPGRLGREWPFLRRVLGEDGRVLDLGCGTGEHSRFLAAHGFDVTAIDASPSMIATAAEAPVPPNLRFVEGDIVEVASLAEGVFDGAICLGNTLPHVQSREAFEKLAAGLRARLRPAAPLVLQVLNYERILSKGLRFLPLDFRGGDDGEAVFLRLMTPTADGRLVFTPTTLRYRPHGEPPVEVVASRSIVLHPWRRGEIERVLGEAGFADFEWYGSFAGAALDPAESTDAIVVGRRR